MKKCVLIIHREPQRLSFLRAFLRGEGYEVVVAIPEESPPLQRADVVLLSSDCASVPKLGHPRLILIGDPHDRELAGKAKHAGAVDFVVTPLHFGELGAKVDRLIHDREAPNLERKFIS